MRRITLSDIKVVLPDLSELVHFAGVARNHPLTQMLPHSYLTHTVQIILTPYNQPWLFCVHLCLLCVLVDGGECQRHWR